MTFSKCATECYLIILFVFKSISLPVMLVTIIQGAVWMSLATQLIGGNGMFFMSYIVALCVLMGATIDYGILMSSTYVTARAEKDKKEALITAVATATPTVFTSGIILVICGFVISLISTQDSISSVGDLLARGTIVSVIMITLVLPSVLYLLDKFILKLTVREPIDFEGMIGKVKNEKVRGILTKVYSFFIRIIGACKSALEKLAELMRRLEEKLDPILMTCADFIIKVAV
ncbi:MAG: MMPL family transporter, partial [Bacteroidaceae bacterium]|nr:MMPL family transporter [Bacteroidaceae bacterium]